MVVLVIDADGWVDGNAGESQSIPIRNHEGITEYAPLHIQRDELNADTNVRIRFILTPQQLKASGVPLQAVNPVGGQRGQTRVLQRTAHREMVH